MPKKPIDPKKDDLRKLWKEEEGKKQAKTKKTNRNNALTKVVSKPPSDKVSISKEWAKLTNIVKTTYPVYLLEEYVEIDKRHRQIAIAYVLGWSVIDLAYVNKSSEATIKEILCRADIKQFMDEIVYHMGDKPVMDKVASLAYAAVRTHEIIMKDPTASHDQRMKAAQWLFERKHGKATQPVEHQANTLLQLYQQLMIRERAEQDEIIDVDTKELN